MTSTLPAGCGRSGVRPGHPRRKAWGIALLLLATAFPAASESVQIITSADRKSVAISRELLQGIFTLRLREWPDGLPVRVFVLPDKDELHRRFARDLLGTHPYVLRNTWDRRVFTGTAFAPVVVESESEMRRWVKSTPGAIGYVLHSSGDGRVRVVPVQKEPSP